MAENTEVKTNAMTEDVNAFVEKAGKKGSNLNGRRICFHFVRRKRKAR